MLRIVVERAGDLLLDEVFRKSLISIGRDPDADVVLDDTTVSALHLVIKSDPGNDGFRFFDQGWNGTVQNGQKVQQGHFRGPLLLQVGEFDLTLIPIVRTDTHEARIASTGRTIPSTARESLPTLADAKHPGQAEAAIPELRSLAGGCDPPMIRLQRRVLVGRSSDCDVRSNLANVSRHHLEITPHDDGFVLKRLSARNGVELNGRRLAPLEECRLNGGDIVSFSGQQLMFLVPGEEPSGDQTVIVEASPNTDLAVYERPCLQEGVTALDVVGFLGAKTSQKFDTAVSMRLGPDARIMLDMGYLVGIDSVGIARLAALVSQASKTGSRIQFIRIPPRVGDVLAQSPFMSLLEKHISRSEMSGVRQFNSSEGIS